MRSSSAPSPASPMPYSRKGVWHSRWVVGLILLAACGGGGGTSSINGAAGDCDTIYPRIPSARDGVADDGATITLDTRGEDDASGNSFEQVGCILAALDAPSYVASLIETTRALDGRQSAEWDNLEAFWSYHPDDGLNLTIHDTR